MRHCICVATVSFLRDYPLISDLSTSIYQAFDFLENSMLDGFHPCGSERCSIERDSGRLVKTGVVHGCRGGGMIGV